MKHKRFEENILVDEAYNEHGKVDKNADHKKSHGIAKNFAESLQYDERKKWYHQLPQEPTSSKTLDENQIEELKKEANSALHGDTMAYETKNNRSGSSDHQWAKTLLNKGAIGDRVAAATILIQDNPLYNLSALRNLVSNVKPAKKRDGIIIIDALSELFVSELLVPEVKLRTFRQHAVSDIDEMCSGNKQMRRTVLKLWHYEEQLKELYGDYVEALNKFAHDSVDANKEKAVSAMCYLLMHHPEREKALLNNIINKLGDPSQAVASKVIYHLCQLLYNHPNMKGVVLNEIEKMLFRTNISPRAQYYGVCFLNQFFLGKDDSLIAENLIRIYFSFFKASIKKGTIDTRLMSAILTGVKRAYPFADKDRLVETPHHVDAIHKLVHLGKFNIAIHALALLFQISSASQVTTDRYYTALYKKLSNPDIFNTAHSALLFSLIYKSLKQDTDIGRVAAFVKRLLQLSCYMTPAQACGMLFLVSQVVKDEKRRGALVLAWSKKEIADEPKIEISETLDDSTDDVANRDEDQPPKQDDDDDVKDEEKEHKKFDLLHGTKQDLLNDDDDEEVYTDLKIDNEGNVKPKKRKKSATVAGWYHAKVGTEDTSTGDAEDVLKNEFDKKDKDLTSKIQLKKAINMDKIISDYNPCVRNPSFAGGLCSAMFELLPLSRHYHPSVKLFAERLLSNQLVQYSGDPLIDFSSVRFLDRFVFKNPKKRSEIAQTDSELKKVRGSHPKFALRKNYSAKGLRSLPVNSTSYLNEDAKRIPVDEKFLYDFLQRRRTVDDSDEDSDAESVNSEDFDNYLDTMTGTRTEDAPDDELDYLADMESTKSKLGAKKRDEVDDQVDDFDDDDDEEGGDDEEVGGDDDIDDDSDGELNISGDDDEGELSGDEDELLLEDSEEDDQVEVPGRRGKKGKMSLKLKGKEDLGSLFASAEEFSTLLEDTATTKKQGSSQAVANTDKASVKQLAWEDRRDQYIKGYNKKILGHKKRNFKSKSLNKNKPADKNGGKRKGGHVGQGPAGKKKKFK